MEALTLAAFMEPRLQGIDRVVEVRTGAPGLSPDNPTPDSKMGTAQYDFVSRGGFIPGGALPAAGSMYEVRVAIKK